MGVYSWNCKCCGHPMLAPNRTNTVNYWMSEVVTIDVTGHVMSGTYDGYGNVDGDAIYIGPRYDQDPTVYHRACWEHAGRPTEFNPRNPSESSECQGHFFEAGEHDLECPVAHPVAFVPGRAVRHTMRVSRAGHEPAVTVEMSGDYANGVELMVARFPREWADFLDSYSEAIAWHLPGDAADYSVAIIDNAVWECESLDFRGFLIGTHGIWCDHAQPSILRLREPLSGQFDSDHPNPLAENNKRGESDIHDA